MARLIVLWVFFIPGSLFAQRVDSFNAGQTFQTIDHFGAHDSWSGQAYGSWDPVRREAISSALFSRENGIGLSGWYYNLAAGVDETIASKSYPWNLRTQETFETGAGQYDWSRNQATGNLLADAKAHGVEKYMMTVYSPTKRNTLSGNPYPDSPGGNNLRDRQQFATYMADVLEHFKNNTNESQRIDFDYISPLNEPQYNWSGGGQEGNGYLSPTEVRNQISTLFDTLQDRGLDTGIRGPESGNIQSMYQGENYIDNIARNSQVNGKVGQTLTFHSYFSDNNANMLASRQRLANEMSQLPGWDVWQTEYAILGNDGSSGLSGNGNDLSMTTALAVARTMHFDLSVANVSAWSYWLAATPYEHNYKDGLIYFDQTNERFEVAKVGWAMGHYSRFLRPGTQRIDFAGANNDIEGLLVSGYRNDDSQELTLVYANQLESSQLVQHDLSNTNGLKSDYFTPFVTSDEDGVDLQRQDSFLIGQDYSIAARSMVTMVSGTFDEDNSGKLFNSIVGDRNYTLGSGVLTLTDSQGTYSGAMDGAGGLLKLGEGEWLMTGNQTYTGQTIVEEGTLVLGGTSNQSVGRIGRDSQVVIRDQGTIRVDFYNALGGFNPSNAPAVRIETGGQLTISDGYSANLGSITLAGGDLGGGSANPSFGNWTINNGVAALGGISSISAPEIQLRGEQSFEVSAGSVLDSTGLISGLQGTTAALVKTGGGSLNVVNVQVDRVQVDEGSLILAINGQRNVAVQTDSMLIAESGSVDIGEDDILIDYDGESARSQLQSDAFNGLLSTSEIDRAVAVLEMEDLGWSAVGGVSVDSTSLLVRSALSGDFNLDDSVDSQDVQTLIDNYCSVGDGWLLGDGDYDGLVGFSDIVALQLNYEGPTIDFYAADQKFVDDWNLALSSVPEPSSTMLGLILMIGVWLPRRRIDTI